jgi:hypothetical protein
VVVSGTLRIVPAVAEPAASREDLLALIAVLREQNVVLAERCAGVGADNSSVQVGMSSKVLRLRGRWAAIERVQSEWKIN